MTALIRLAMLHNGGWPPLAIERTFPLNSLFSPYLTILPNVMDWSALL